MKQVIFLFVLSVYLISCSGSKELHHGLLNFSIDTAGYYSNPYIAKYRNSPGFTPPELALAYIEKFRRHTYRGWRKGRLKVTWTLFDQATLNSIVCDPQTDSVAFYLAAFPEGAKVPKEYKKTPFVLMQAKSRPSPNLPKSSTYFFLAPRQLPSDICPPPKTGCKVLFVEPSALH